MSSLNKENRVPEAIDGRIARLAATQHGVFTRTQAVGSGASSGVIEWRLANERWERIHRGVYRLAGVPPSWRQALLAACLAWGGGTAASHRAAAALWTIAGFEPGPVELTAPLGSRPGCAGIVVHQPLRLDPVDLTRRDGIPVTTPARTLLDIAAVVTRSELEEALDDALRRKLVSISRLRWRLRQMGRSGRPGIAILRALVDERTRTSSVPQSVFETRLLRALKEAGLPDPIVQHEIRDRGRLVAVVDLAFPEQRIAIEADGYRWHAGRLRWEHDLARRNSLTSLGWRVIHVTWADLADRRERAICSIVRLLQS
jgi:very-short-patch-repair endonuclease